MIPFSNLFSLKQILQQIKEDLIGKDSFRGFSLSYSWLANQFGHFSLGFIPTLVIYSAIVKPDRIDQCINNATLITGGVWSIFEVFNLVYPILSNKIFKTKLPFFEKGNKYIFKPEWSNLALDTFTDVCYFWCGALTCNLFIQLTNLSYINDINNLKYFFILLKIIIIFLSYYWYTVRMNLQSASLTKQFRLGQWTGNISSEDIATVLSYVKKSKSSDHLIIGGFDKTNKTELAIALGNEMAFKFKKVWYSNFMKFLSKLFDKDKAINKYWNIKELDLIIIDDLNIGRPYFKDFIYPERFFKIIKDANSHEFLKSKKIIWVIGIKNKFDLTKWETLIKDFFNEEIVVKSICLDHLDKGNN